MAKHRKKGRVTNIAIIGAGNVGGALGTRLVAKTHRIAFGVPDPADAKYAPLKANPNTALMAPAAAAKDAAVVLLAVPWDVAKQAVEGCGNLAGKILVDCTNPIAADFSGLAIGHTTSGAEMVAGWARGAKVVKCFNQTGFENMANPSYGPQRTVMFAAGDDADAVETVVSLANDVGFQGVALKGLRCARQLEQLGWLWIDMAIKQGKGRNIAFALLHRG